MKERIVIEKEVLERLIKALPIQWFDNKEKTDKLILFGKEYKTEKYPTNWEELKTMCKDSEVCINITKGDIKGKQFECIEIAGLILCENKNIYIDTLTIGIVILAQNRTPAQMWQIIKSLIGEE